MYDFGGVVLRGPSQRHRSFQATYNGEISNNHNNKKLVKNSNYSESCYFINK